MSVKFHGEEFIDGLHLLEGALYNAGVQAIRGAVKDTEAHAKATTRFQDRTGKTRGSIEGTANGLEGEVKAAGASKWIENGTEAHLIERKKAKALRFEVAGSVRFAKRVHHPGTKAQPFMTEARDLGEKVLEYGLESLTDEAIKRSK